ncbi:MAG: DNA recombination/repair protein RecA, partial [Actinomycetia bacterium]|nr:DNA recombination/repair protein RecA [Actinomycetes bacterium]
KGLVRELDILDLGVQHNIINKSGTWFSYKDNKIGQGKFNSTNFLKENPQISAEIEMQIKEAAGIGVSIQENKENSDIPPKNNNGNNGK